ncbi:hypothetical protein C1645_875361 [Glomus cerebriforme]|uniref:Uncharacterized protein n=1 Tax=Glomus cerebriforme TaxID=658196 RepID=A0A397T2F3_9GLOM|nr:hypothetical protein C1645_875361 [Glomus cerebriforme]
MNESFLINFLKKFYNKIIETNDFNNFEKNLSDWIIEIDENNGRNPNKILEEMQYHKESKCWFSSLIGFFYQFGIGCLQDNKKAMEFYFLAIYNEQDSNKDFNKPHLIEEINDSFDSLRNKNIIIGKYLLSLFYYSDIILDINYKQNKLITLQRLTENDDLESQCNLIIGAKANYRKIFESFLSSAEKGNPNAQFYLATCYMDGIGTEKDEKKAFDWFLKSDSLIIQNINKHISFKEELKLAITNNLKAQVYVGYCYQNGIGINKNEKKAFKWYLKSAENGNAMAQNNLGVCYKDGIGTDKNETKAFECYMKLAIAGVSHGQCNVGFCYEKGIGTLKDETKAFEWYFKSAEKGNAMAQNNLGDCYQYGKGTDKNESKAFEWYMKSAIAGDSNGQCNIGFCYDNGVGTSKDEIKAFNWYFESAAKGNAIAQNNLGIYCQYGKGTYKDETKAFELFLKSATAGCVNGQCNLGFCYGNGIGTVKNETKSFEWYLKSAEGGKTIAQDYVGDCYYYGKGIDKNINKAIYWYNKASDSGIKAAKYKLDRISSSI